MGSSPLVSTTQKKTAVERFFSYHEKNGFARRRGERIGFHMKKKWLAAAAAVLCAATMASCGQGVVDLTSSGQGSASSAPVSSALSEEEVEDTLEGLEQYMASLGYISGTPSTMRGDMIGAKEEGHRYATAAATVEFYEYDLSNLNDTAKAVRESVEADGTFDMIGQTVQGAVLSDSGKYLMIYSANGTGEEATATKEAAIAAFRAFKAE